MFKQTNKNNMPLTRRACGNCGKLGHLSRTCEAAKKAHAKIGVEIEGWWLNLSEAKRQAENWHMSGTDDGSLAAHNDADSWEFRTRPGSLGEAISQIIAVYPDYTHRSAGMHVHVSFDDAMDVSCFATPEFLDYYKQRWNAWGNANHIDRGSDFWWRLNGGNAQYCGVNTTDRLTTRYIQNGSRYYQLNFTSWANHQTLECRMLPLFRDCRLAVLAIEELISIYEDFLRDCADAALAKLDREAVVSMDDIPDTIERVIPYEIGTIRERDGVAVDLAYDYHCTLDTVTLNRDASIDLEVSSRDERYDVELIEAGDLTPGHRRLFEGPLRNNYGGSITRVLTQLGGV